MRFTSLTFDLLFHYQREGDFPLFPLEKRAVTEDDRFRRACEVLLS